MFVTLHTLLYNAPLPLTTTTTHRTFFFCRNDRILYEEPDTTEDVQRVASITQFCGEGEYVFLCSEEDLERISYGQGRDIVEDIEVVLQ